MLPCLAVALAIVQPLDQRDVDQGAHLEGADLRDAGLRDADLRDADLRGVIGRTEQDIRSVAKVDDRTRLGGFSGTERGTGEAAPAS